MGEHVGVVQQASSGALNEYLLPSLAHLSPALVLLLCLQVDVSRLPSWTSLEVSIWFCWRENHSPHTELQEWLAETLVLVYNLLSKLNLTYLLGVADNI